MPDAAPEPAPLALSLDHLGRRFGEVEALRDLHLELPAARFTAFLGPSGCGKTTLLRLIGGLDQPSAGAVRFASAPGPGDISYAFQEPRLLPWRTVLHNVALPLELAGAPRAVREARAREMLARVGLADFADARSHTLSGGMKMRAALARALVTRPRLLLLDEPFGALDEITRTRLDDELRALWLARPMTVVLITHSISEAVYLADHVVVLAPRPGRVIEAFDVAIAQAERGPDLRTEARFVAYVARAQAALERGVREASR
ncbi:MAG: ABC transporter ATP-binding protein [Myxococcales bacterium]|nr:ABC transporter ATP-binding protein [Myxococcales bacterium]